MSVYFSLAIIKVLAVVLSLAETRQQVAEGGHVQCPPYICPGNYVEKEASIFQSADDIH